VFLLVKCLVLNNGMMCMEILNAKKKKNCFRSNVASVNEHQETKFLNTFECTFEEHKYAIMSCHIGWW